MNIISISLVTPCVGVWIETALVLISIVMIMVTPCVGVWIETALPCLYTLVN